MTPKAMQDQKDSVKLSAFSARSENYGPDVANICVYDDSLQAASSTTAKYWTEFFFIAYHAKWKTVAYAAGYIT